MYTDGKAGLMVNKDKKFWDDAGIFITHFILLYG